MSGYILRLPEEESIVLSGPVARRLIQAGDGDAALLYMAVLQNKGVMDDDRLLKLLAWPRPRFDRALSALAGQGLISRPDGSAPVSQSAPAPAPAQERPEYTRADMARALEGGEFSSLTAAVEEKLGKKLTTPDLNILLGLYDYLGLPADVIYLLVCFCAERTVAQYGPGRKPTLRQIEKEGFTWARLGLMNQEKADGYIRKYHQGRQAMPRMMRLLRLGDRLPAPSEEKYLLAWNDMGFEDAAIELAYDKTILKCKELKWPYMNKILTSWHQKGLHTVDQVQQGDRPADRSAPAQPRREESKRADMARMEKYLKELRQQSPGKEGA